MDIRAGGWLCTDIRMFLPGLSTAHHDLWRSGLGFDPSHCMTTRKFTPQGDAVDIRETYAIMVRWYLVLPTAGGGYLGCGPG